jgi:hypothetical protein
MAKSRKTKQTGRLNSLYGNNVRYVKQILPRMNVKAAGVAPSREGVGKVGHNERQLDQNIEPYSKKKTRLPTLSIQKCSFGKRVIKDKMVFDENSS